MRNWEALTEIRAPRKVVKADDARNAARPTNHLVALSDDDYESVARNVGIRPFDPHRTVQVTSVLESAFQLPRTKGSSDV